MPTSRTSKFLQSIAVGAVSSVGAFAVWTKHCTFEPMDPATEPLFRSPFFSKYNPRSNPTTHDTCVRRLPLFKIKPELVEDTQKGGSKLVEAFCAGVWGGFNYTPQRLYMQRKYRSNPATAHQLWDQPALLASPYNPGTEITDHFVVLSKTPTAILIRCGDSPLTAPDAPRDSDGLFEISVKPELEKGVVEFRLKSIFYSGAAQVEAKEGVERRGPMDAKTEWAHRMYTKLWMEGAVGNVKQ